MLLRLFNYSASHVSSPRYYSYLQHASACTTKHKREERSCQMRQENADSPTNWTNWSKCVTFPTWQWCLSGWGVSDGVVMNSDQLGIWWCDMRGHSHNQSDVMGLARDTSNQDNHNFIISCGSSSSSDSFSPVSHSCTKQSLQELQGLVESFPLSLFTVPHLLGGKVVLGNSRRHFKWVIQMYGERFRHLNYNLIWQISLSCLSFSEWQTGKIVWS